VAVASVKAYLAVAGLLAGALLAVAVVATAMPEIARELGVSVEQARILYSAVLFGAAVGVGFGRGFSRRFFGDFLSLVPRPLLFVTPSRRCLPRPRPLPSRTKRRGASRGGRPRRRFRS